MFNFGCPALCDLFCCPPLPSRIVAKLAFTPPPVTYSTCSSDENDSICFTPLFKQLHPHIPWEIFDLTKATTKLKSKIVIAYMTINHESKLTFLWSHGNAVDLGLMVHHMYKLGSKLNVNMMCYDYSGYGESSGKPLENNLYADAECAMEALRLKYSVPLDQIVLYGQSIGSVPTVFLATMYKVAAVVLHSPLSSGLRMGFPRLQYDYSFDVLSNHARASRIQSPTLVIHGTADEVIPSVHSEQLLEVIPNPLPPLFIKGAGHNNCELFGEFLVRMEHMLYFELGFPDRRDQTIESGSLRVLSREPDWSVGPYCELHAFLQVLDKRNGATDADTTRSTATTSGTIDSARNSPVLPILPSVMAIKNKAKTKQGKFGDCRRAGPSKGLHKHNAIHIAQPESENRSPPVGYSSHASNCDIPSNHDEVA